MRRASSGNESRVRGNVQAQVREGAERNVLKSNALAAYFTRRMEPWCARR
jgi:hypothetical protein